MPRAAKDPATGLTQKQERFCVLYVTGADQPDPEAVMGNATACYRLAFNCKNAKAATIARRGKELLHSGPIQARIAVLRREVAEKAGITAADILREAALMAMARPQSILNDDGSVKPMDQWPEAVKAAFAGMDVEALFEGRGEDREQVGNLRKYKFWDKNSAMERMFKHFGLFEKDNEQKADPVRELLAAIADRAKIAPPGAPPAGKMTPAGR